MIFFFSAFLLLAPFAYATPVLKNGETYAAKKELTGAAPAAKALESFYSEMEMNFESYDPNEPGVLPLMSTHTDQRVKNQQLPKLDPKDPAAPKDGFHERVELTFERLINSSKVRIPGMKQLFETKSDLGAALGSSPFVIRGDGKGNKKVDNLDRIRADVLAKLSDPIARTTVNTLLSESILLKAGTAPGQDSSCLSGLAQKKPGAKWKFSREEQGIKFDYDCDFQGWAEVSGKKVAVVQVRAGKQRTLRPQPNGVPGMAETEGEGVVYWEPESQESLLRMETRITVEPAEEELKQLKTKGAPIPRNRSVLRHWNHIYGL